MALVECQPLKLLKKAIREGQICASKGCPSSYRQRQPCRPVDQRSIRPPTGGRPPEESLLDGDGELSFRSIRYKRSNSKQVVSDAVNAALLDKRPFCRPYQVSRIAV